MTTPHYDTGDPWTDGYNMAVIGKTQTGKTSAVRELHAESPRTSVWLNAAGKDRVDDVPGVTVRSLDGVREAFAEDRYAIEWVSDDRLEDVKRLQEWMFAVAENCGRKLPMQVVLDEVQEIAPETKIPDTEARDTVRRFGKRGVKRNIKTVALTQDPTSYDKQSLRQSEYRLVFPMSHENRTSSVLKRMGIDWGAVDRGDRYTGALHDDTGTVIDPTVKAEARFA